MGGIEVVNLVAENDVHFLDIHYDPWDVGFCAEYMKTINEDYTQIILF